MKKIVFFVFIAIIAFFGYTFFRGNPQNDASNTEVTNTVQNFQPLSPERFVIEKLGVNAAVEHVGQDSQGRMDVPKNADNVAWYMHGHKPGEKASAVLAGHFDRASGGPAVFYDLDKLQTGDKVKIFGENGEELTYVVTNKQIYQFDKVPLEEIFDSTDKARLNLITCDGVFDQETKNYSQRLVVYTEIVD